MAKETDWVKVYDVAGTIYVDSKYRTYECDASAEQFLTVWVEADEQEKAELQAALEFFPYRSGLERILRAIRADEPQRAEEIEARWFHHSGQLRKETQDYLDALIPEFYGRENARRLILKTPWFRAYFDGQGFQFDCDQYRPLSAEEYEAARKMATTRAARDALNLYCGLLPEV